jgi:hypothetical protein
MAMCPVQGKIRLFLVTEPAISGFAFRGPKPEVSARRRDTCFVPMSRNRQHGLALAIQIDQPAPIARYHATVMSYFFLPDPKFGCQPADAPLWLGAAATREL